jgi:hypothetical protein
VRGVCCCLCKYRGSIQLRQSFQLNLWLSFLAGRVPRRKNFAGSSGKRAFHPVWQWFLNGTTYSHVRRLEKRLLKFSRAVQIVSRSVKGVVLPDY